MKTTVYKPDADVIVLHEYDSDAPNVWDDSHTVNEQGTECVNCRTRAHWPGAKKKCGASFLRSKPKKKKKPKKED